MPHRGTHSENFNAENEVVQPEFAYINSSGERHDLHSESPAEAPQGPKVIVVEDNDAILTLLRIALTRTGYQVLPFRDAESAIPVFKSQGAEIAVAIIDELLPKLHGQELIRAVRSDIPNTKIILTSGYYGDDFHPPLVDSSYMVFMHKPYAIKTLLETVKAFAPLKD